MTVGAMTNIDRALLAGEWLEWSTHRECPSCEAMRADGHGPDCPHDLALCERGYPDQASRDRARALLQQAAAATMPPPGAAPEPGRT